MQGLSPAVISTVVLVAVTLSLPCFLYGAYYIIETEPVTWGVLMHHLKFVVTGLVLTTVPLLFWMAPRLPDQFGGLSALHAILGLQAYAMLAFGFTGIVRIFRAKFEHDLYEEYDEGRAARRNRRADDEPLALPSPHRRLRLRHLLDPGLRGRARPVRDPVRVL